MKNKIILIGIFAFLTTISINLSALQYSVSRYEGNGITSMQTGHSATQMMFPVNGKCSLCKNRIETAALLVPGVKDAHWNSDSHFLTVIYKGNVLKSDVQKAIANAGHDTNEFKAKDEDYKALPVCCQYFRK